MASELGERDQESVSKTPGYGFLANDGILVEPEIDGFAMTVADLAVRAGGPLSLARSTTRATSTAAGWHTRHLQGAVTRD